MDHSLSQTVQQKDILLDIGLYQDQEFSLLEEKMEMLTFGTYWRKPMKHLRPKISALHILLVLSPGSILVRQYNCISLHKQYNFARGLSLAISSM